MKEVLFSIGRGLISIIVAIGVLIFPVILAEIFKNEWLYFLYCIHLLVLAYALGRNIDTKP